MINDIKIMILETRIAELRVEYKARIGYVLNPTQQVESSIVAKKIDALERQLDKLIVEREFDGPGPLESDAGSSQGASE